MYPKAGESPPILGYDHMACSDRGKPDVVDARKGRVTAHLCTVLTALRPVMLFELLKGSKWAPLLLLPVLGGGASAQFSTIPAAVDHLTPGFLREVPPNGVCSGASVVPVPMNTPVTVTGNNEGSPTDPVFVANLVWEGFTTTACSDLTVSYCGTSPNFLGGLVNLVAGCPVTNMVFNTAANIIPNICGDGNFGVRFPSLPAGTYYYPVLEAPGSSGDYTLVFTAEPCTATPPANASCAGAIPIGSAATCEYQSGTVEHATAAGNTGTACGNGDVSDGVWYSFVATSPSHDITVAPSAEFNVHLSLIQGTCGSQTLLACAIGQNFGASTTLSATGLVVGGTYYLRVADWYAGTPRTSTFDICVVSVATSACDAAAGNLIPVEANVCYAGSATTIAAMPSGNAHVPAGFETDYLLFSSSGVVLQRSTTPQFTSLYVGGFTIHALVYDPTTFDPTGILLGQATIGSINEQFVQGGGIICASLDITGAAISVENCCTANAGTLHPMVAQVCFEEDSLITISAMGDGNAVVPTGSTITYLLCTGATHLIQGTSDTASFVVSATGTYTIHAVVHDTVALPLDTLQPGLTTLDMLNDHFTVGGGPLCGALSAVGASIAVVRCCPGTLGNIVVADDTLCHTSSGAAFSWTLDGAAVPIGYEVLYLISTGDTIQDSTSTTSVLLSGPAHYRVHQLILDPTTLDIASVLNTLTTMSGLNELLAQGGGEVCALLDLVGADLIVADCRPANDDCTSPRYVTVQLLENCLDGMIQGDNTYATQGTAPTPSCGDAASTYADVWYVFNSGDNTGITIAFDPGTMTSWGIAIQDACDGSELLCEMQPAAPVDIDTPANTTLLVRVFTDLDAGLPGQFAMCITGAVTSTICNGGIVTTLDDAATLTVCQDAEADVVGFRTTSAAPVNYTYVVTDEDSIVVAVVAGNELDFNSLPLGEYQVHGISHDGMLQGHAVGARLMDITTTGQCLEHATGHVEVRVEICSGVRSLDEASWVLWPNPNHGRFGISSTTVDGPLIVQVVGADGRMVYDEQGVALPGTTLEVALDGASRGAYVVRLIDGNGVATLRVVVD